MSDVDAARERGWWTSRLVQLDDGTWDVLVTFADGHALPLLLQPSRDLDLVIAAAVEAHLKGDVRWTKKSDRGR